MKRVLLSLLPLALLAPALASSTPAEAATTNPFAVRPPMRSADWSLDQAMAQALSAGDGVLQSAIATIAAQPRSRWLVGGESKLTESVRADGVAAIRARRTPTFVVYAVPHRDCSGQSAGGLGAAEYRAYVRRVAGGFGMSHPAVVLEPDGLSTVDCLPAGQRAERYRLLSDAVSVFTAARATVYVDAGLNTSDVDAMASRLVSSGVRKARGVAVNVANYDWTASETVYAKALAARVPGLHAVIDTSRNGQGPSADRAWCNPSGRGLGDAPTVVHDPVVDAHLWIKRPGMSDGSCAPGMPPAGDFFPARAKELAARAVL